MRVLDSLTEVYSLVTNIVGTKTKNIRKFSYVKSNKIKELSQNACKIMNIFNTTCNQSIRMYTLDI